MKLLIGLAFIAILASLCAAGYFMVRTNNDATHKTARMVKALAWRIGLSVGLFVCVLVFYKIGWISPTGIGLTK